MCTKSDKQMHWLPVDVRSELRHDAVSGRCNEQKLINLEVSLCTFLIAISKSMWDHKTAGCTVELI